MRLFCTAAAICGLWALPVAADPLHDAIRDGDVAQARQLIEQGASPSAPDEAGEPPLLIAALSGKSDVVALLLERGADLDARNERGLTALHAAAYGGNLDAVKLLISRGASVNGADNFFRMSPLHAAAEEGHADIVAFLLSQGADVEAKERNGYTPLTQAGWREYWEAASVLMKAGAACQTADLVGEWLHTECTKRR